MYDRYGQVLEPWKCTENNNFVRRVQRVSCCRIQIAKYTFVFCFFQNLSASLGRFLLSKYNDIMIWGVDVFRRIELKFNNISYFARSFDKNGFDRESVRNYFPV